MEKLSSFQLETKSLLEALLKQAGVKYESSVDGGPEQFALVYRLLGVVSYIYPDGADIGGSGLDKRFEKYDYNSLAELGCDYVQFIQSLIRTHHR